VGWVARTARRSRLGRGESSKNLKIVEEALENTYRSFEFVSYDTAKKEGLFVRRPERKEVLQEINEQLIVEFYNR